MIFKKLLYAIFLLNSLSYLKLTNGSWFVLPLFLIDNVFFKQEWNLLSNSLGSSLNLYVTKLNKTDFNLPLILSFLLLIISYKKPNKAYLFNFFIFINLILTYPQISDTYRLAETNTLDLQLLNGVMVIHPTLLLYTTTGAISLLLLSLTRGNSLYAVDNLRSKFLKTSVFQKKIGYTLFNLNLISLLLGSYWAVQELNWGGFWSWDTVEIFSLCTALILYTISHWYGYGQQHLRSFVLLTLMILSLILIRLDLVNSVHGFIINKSNNMSISILIALMTICIPFFLLVLASSVSISIHNSHSWMLYRVLMFASNCASLLVITYAFITILLNLSFLDLSYPSHEIFIFLLSIGIIANLLLNPSLIGVLVNSLELVIVSYLFDHIGKRPPLNIKHTICLFILCAALFISPMSVNLAKPCTFGSNSLYVSKISTLSTSFMSLVRNFIDSTEIHSLVLFSTSNLNLDIKSSSSVRVNPLLTWKFIEVYSPIDSSLLNISAFYPLLLTSLVFIFLFFFKRKIFKRKKF